MVFDDFQRSANLAADPDTYKMENDAIAWDGRLGRAVSSAGTHVRTDSEIGC